MCPCVLATNFQHGEIHVFLFQPISSRCRCPFRRCLDGRGQNQECQKHGRVALLAWATTGSWVSVAPFLTGRPLASGVAFSALATSVNLECPTAFGMAPETVEIWKTVADAGTRLCASPLDRGVATAERTFERLPVNLPTN